MAFSTKTTLLISFLLLVYICSGHNGAARPVYSLQKDGFRLHARKLLVIDVVLDYDDATANPRHDPRRGRGGGCGRNP
ncbi:hypothetical protein L1987_42926 [Smallanthus sonchifolius]|uniref:Uncharacterized protein n=1 Tax=Smallanthus sonchifolius TaxID=185202 RepID=A0ACB9GKZ2_9ASTR|nr:hypothetical protein L1987_42926 [Smallanthus sonchifolius]